MDNYDSQSNPVVQLAKTIETPEVADFAAQYGGIKPVALVRCRYMDTPLNLYSVIKGFPGNPPFDKVYFTNEFANWLITDAFINGTGYSIIRYPIIPGGVGLQGICVTIGTDGCYVVLESTDKRHEIELTLGKDGKLLGSCIRR